MLFLLKNDDLMTPKLNKFSIFKVYLVALLILRSTVYNMSIFVFSLYLEFAHLWDTLNHEKTEILY